MVVSTAPRLPGTAVVPGLGGHSPPRPLVPCHGPHVDPRHCIGIHGKETAMVTTVGYQVID